MILNCTIEIINVEFVLDTKLLSDPHEFKGLYKILSGKESRKRKDQQEVSKKILIAENLGNSWTG